MKIAKVLLAVIFGVVVIAASSDSGMAADDKPLVINVATTPTPSHRVTHNKDRPGWQIELFEEVEARTGVKFEYVFVPWDQALRLVRTGAAQAAFNSSYKPERAVYGAYPMRDGKPDPSRATVLYAYVLYAHRDSGITWDGQRIRGLDGPLAVEKSAAILSQLGKLGVQTLELPNYEAMLSMVSGRRVQALAGVDQIVDTMLTTKADHFADIVKVEPPLQRRVGFLMFSKSFCASKSDVCEAVWNAIGEIRQTDAFKAMRASYENP